MDVKEQGVGYLSYEWNGAPGGVMDAQAGGNALLGLDETVRYFNRRQSRGFGSAPYEIPVLVGSGSWIVVVLGVLAIPATVFANAYVKKAGEKMAERDFSGVGFTDVARKSMDALVKLVRLLKAKRGKLDWATTEIRWNASATIAYISDVDGNLIEIPAEYISWYRELPSGALERLAAPIAPGRTLTVAARQLSGELDLVVVSSDTIESLVASDDADADEFLFPELVHGQEVELEGIITRGNQSTNSIGFQYQGHILNCNPEQGSVKRFKSAMFLQCRVRATVNRHVTSKVALDYRPTLLISTVTPLEEDDTRVEDLF